MKYKFLGYKQFYTKDKKRLLRMIAVMSEHTAVSKQNGAVGMAVQELFLPDDCKIEFTEADVGKEILIDYTVYNGKASICGVKMLTTK